MPFALPLARPPRRPLDLGFELSNLCNLHCTHCIRGSHQASVEHLDLDLVRRVLDEAAAFQPLRVVLTGGEPLAAPTFGTMVAELARRAIPWRLVTNGWLLPRELPVLVAHPPELVRVSLSGGTEATHDGQRGRGSFRRALLGAAVCLSRGLRTELSMVALRENRHELLAAAALAGELGVAELHVILPQPTPESAANGSDLSPDEWDALAAELPHVAAASRVPVRLDYGARMPLAARPRCGPLAGRQLYVDARGRVPFCCQLSRYGSGAEPVVGDLARESLAEVYERLLGATEAFEDETAARHANGAADRLDEYPCLACARRHARTGFLADFPEHPWTALAALPA